MKFLRFLLILVSISSAQAETFDPSRLTPVTLAMGLKRPMELEVAPDGRVFFIELAGQLRIFHPQTQKLTEAGTLSVATQQENGLIGMALDPDFAENQRIYLQYSPPDYSGQHVSRFVMKGDQLDLKSEKLLLKFEEQRLQCCHHAGSLEFGPDGCLFIATGDNTHPGGDSKGYAPIDERPERMPWDAQKSASNKFSYNGKVLRIRPLDDGTYEVPEGNLFPKDGSQGHPEIYVMGCRNPWRINIDQKTGYLYWGEVGPDAGAPGDRGPAGHDEINQARKAGNFGWPYFVGPNLAYPDVDFETGEIGNTQDPAAPRNDSPNSVGSQVLPPAQPAFVYYHRNTTDDFPMLRTGGRTACAGPVYHFDPELKSEVKFPAHFDNTLFIYEWSRHWIFGVKLDANSDIHSLEELMPDYGFVRPIDMDFGPAGNLYLIEYGETWGENPDCKLVRIDYIRGNRPPHTQLTANGTAGKPPLKVAFSSEGTTDPDGDAISFEWRILPDTNVVSTEANPTLTFATIGATQVTMTARDPAGAEATATFPVLVGNDPPQIQIETPQDGDFFEVDQPIPWKVTVQDTEDTEPAPERAKLFYKVVDAKSFDAVQPSLGGLENLPPGLELMKRSDCFNCHMVGRKLVGPSYLEVATRYRGDSEALDRSAKRIVEGSSGIWGPVPMVPHPQHGIEQSRQMMEWILSLGEDSEDAVLSGLEGEFTISKLEKLKKGMSTRVVILEASYLDGGAFPIAPLSASQTIRLRLPRVEAEYASEHQGLSLTSRGAGAISHGSYLKFSNLNLTQIRKATIQVSSGGPGGVVEFRHGAIDGELLGSVAVEPKGDWNTYFPKDLPLTPSTARGDLYVRFVNEGVGNGIMNLDWIEFSRNQ